MNKVLDRLREAGAIITGSHFVLTSGKHAATYINKDALYPHTEQTFAICEMMAKKVKDREVDTVVGPALGGIILSQWTAYHLTKMKGKEVCGVYTEKSSRGGQVVSRGYDRFISGKKVLVVEDLISTGGSAKKVVNAVRSIGGEVIAIIVMVNRNPKQVDSASLGSPLLSLATLETEVYDEAQCPLCESGVPINTTLGHGRKFTKKNK